MINRLMAFCQNKKQIYIYGAGKYGRIVCLFLEEKGIMVEGFIISERMKDKNEVLEHSVYAYSDISSKARDESTGIVIAVNNTITRTIEKDLCSSQNCNYLIIDGEGDIRCLLNRIRFKNEYTFKNNILVLVYHRVGDIGYDTRNLSMEENLFERQLIYLKNNFSLIRSEDEWTRSQGTSVVITFDDGYCDFYNVILPILERNEIPATVFISTRNIGKSDEFWGDVLEYLVVNTDRNSVTFLDENYPTASKNEKLQSMFKIRDVLKNTNGDRRAELMADLANTLGVIAKPRITHRTMTESEIIKCSQSPYITIGAHTKTHCCLSYEEKEVQYDEINSSKTDLEKIIGKDVEVFAYPYGGKEDFNEETIKIAKRIGFKRVYAAYEGMTGMNTEYGRIPRNNISMCSNMDETIRRIQEIRYIYGDPYI